MQDKVMNVLFLCTGNSARSIMAEALLRRWGMDKFWGYSAGSLPRGRIHPLALELLRKEGLHTQDLRSKSWDEFSSKDAPVMDIVITVCDRAASEVCPVWPGQPITAHWGVADPDRPDLSEDEQRRLFRKAYLELDHRIKIFTSLPLQKLDRLSLQKQLDGIGSSFPRAS
jgi:protein-tyrosine-phosphatase